MLRFDGITQIRSLSFFKIRNYFSLPDYEAGVRVFLRAESVDASFEMTARHGIHGRLQFHDSTPNVEVRFRECLEDTDDIPLSWEDLPFELECTCAKSKKADSCPHLSFAVIYLWCITRPIPPSIVVPGQGQTRLQNRTTESLRKARLRWTELETRQWDARNGTPETENKVSPETATTSQELALERLIFCLPKEPFQPEPGDRLHAQSTETAEISASTPVLEKAFRASFQKPNLLLSHVPLFFRSSPGFPSHYLDEKLYLEEQWISPLLQYRFTDGTILTAREILFHPYCAKVPELLLPLLSHIPETLQTSPDYISTPLGENSPSPSAHKTELTYLSVLIHAFENPQIRVPVSIAFQTDPTERRRIYPLHKVELLEDIRFLIQLNCQGNKPRIYLKPRALSVESSDSTNWINFGNFIYDLENKFLYLSPLGNLQRRIFEVLMPHAQSGVKVSFRPVPVFEFDNFESVPAKMELLRAEFASDEVSIEVAPMSMELTAESYTPTVSLNWTSRELHFYFRFLRPTQGGQYLGGFSALFIKILGCLKGGLITWKPLLQKEILNSVSGAKKDRDIRILKHVGIASLVFAELISYLLNKKLLNQEVVETAEDFKTKLFQKLMGVVELSEENIAPGSTFEKITSRFSLELIEEILRTLSNQVEHPFCFYDDTGEVSIQSGHRHYLALLLTLIEQWMIETQGKCFQKNRSTPFADFQISSESLVLNPTIQTLQGFGSLSLESNGLSQEFAQNFLFRLPALGFQILIDQRQVEGIDSTEFVPDFELKTTGNSGAATKKEGPETDRETALDWFELHPRFFFRGEEIDLEQAALLATRGMIEFNGKFYFLKDRNLPSLRKLQHFWEQISQSQDGTPAGKKKKKKTSIFHLARSQTLDLLALQSTGIKVRGDATWNEIARFYESLSKPRADIVLPASFHADLKQYQKEGVQWLLDLYNLHLGGILADDMGLGKTVQALAFLEILRAQGKMGKVLIVVPTTLTFNWSSEMARFAPDIKIIHFNSKERDTIGDTLNQEKDCVLICTYGLFTDYASSFTKVRWNIQIFDEAQNLKNIQTKRANACRESKAQFKLCLTGTPLENHLGEFFSLMDLTVPGSLGDYKAFKNTYVTPETLSRDATEMLKLKVKPLVLRRNKTSILSQLPPKSESMLKLPFSPKQQKIYRDIALSWNQKVRGAIEEHGEARSQMIMLTALLRLRQVCSDPSSVPNVQYLEEPPKITALVSALKDIIESGESALIFTQFIQMYERVRQELEKNGVPHFHLNGSTPKLVRERELSQFQSTKEPAVLLMTLKTGGMGLNLVKASYVFHLEPWWNPAVENQATDRAHRIGQEKPVQVYRYIMADSVEEKIEVLKLRKQERFRSLFSDTEQSDEFSRGGSHLTQNDFEYLLGVQK